MSRFQQITLLILALILVAVIALVAVAVSQTNPTPAATVSSGDQTNTWAAEFLSTNAATVQALQTGLPLTLIALTPTSP